MANIKLAFRTLFRTPFVTAVAVLSLALGIGANAAIFSLFNQMLLRPLPVPNPGSLVNLAAPGPNPGSQSCSQAGDCTEVGKALDAVEMANSWPCSPAQAAVPLFCALGEVPSNLFFDNLENTSSGNWATTTISGVNHWFYPMLPNPLEFGPFATSGTQNIWGYDWAALGDSAIAMTSSVGIPAGARLQFNHAYGFESDGGVIEYSTDGGGNWLDAGSLISGGATYGGAIPAAGGNPLAGRSGFVGDSFGYTASQLDLASLAGQNVRFRFRMGEQDCGSIAIVTRPEAPRASPL